MLFQLSQQSMYVIKREKHHRLFSVTVYVVDFGVCYPILWNFGVTCFHTEFLIYLSHVFCIKKQ